MASSQSGCDYGFENVFDHAYMSLSDIMATNQKINCKFEKSIKGLGFVDPSSDDEDIPINIKLDIPFWLARKLSFLTGGSSDKLIEIECPKAYDNNYREILEADASVVDLHKNGPHYYTLGENLVKLRLDESEDIARSLVSTFHQRFRKLVNYSMCISLDINQDMIAFERSLDSRELKLFKQAKKAASEFKKWEQRTFSKISANEMVIGLKKRKRAALESEEIFPNHRN